MQSFHFTKYSYSLFLELESNVRERVEQKLEWIKKHPDILSLLRPLKGYEPASYRLRIGNYRLIIHQKAKSKFVIVDIGHRKNIYQ
ncbi:type II toxin-antitoxin system RelE/ParE family toxin [Candidatus Gracilibacteria bacterium]|nr:type II toxin-antitoxin system RelE/ParE family toxin [Candidatus Gracilibacteria bacterium]